MRSLLTGNKRQHKSWEFSFLGGLTEDYSLEDSLSVSSDERLQGQNGDVSIYVIVVKRIRAIKDTSWEKVAASHEEHLSLLMLLVLF